MGDERRFRLFADFIESNVPKSARIADVAAGKGSLSFELRSRDFNVVPFETHPRRGGQVSRLGMRVCKFTADMASDFDVLVGMHPDEATDVILNAACCTSNVMAIVCPCCAKYTDWVYWGNKLSQRDWINHLIRQSAKRGLELNRDRLKMNGASIVLYGQRAA